MHVDLLTPIMFFSLKFSDFGVLTVLVDELQMFGWGNSNQKYSLMFF